MEVKGSNLQVAMVAPGDIATNSIATQYRQPVEDLDPLYRARYKKADDGMAANVDHGMEASYVAEEMYKILERDELKPYYVVGELVQRASVKASRLLPGWLWEKVLGKYYS